MTAQPISPDRVTEIEAALNLYGFRLVEPPERVAHSVRNENYRVLTDSGPLFVRFHRATRSLGRLRREHRAILWASGQRIPVAVPLTSSSGDTLNEVSGRIVALFPWIEGRPLERGHISVAQASAMGEMHGRLHALFASYLDADLPWFWDSAGPNTADSVQVFLSYVERLSEFDLSISEHDVIRACLEAQLNYLRSAQDLKPPDPAASGVQPVHGDYHERNVLFDADRVVAVVDWDMVTRMPRAVELVRSLAFAQLLDPPTLEAYLTAYGGRVALSTAECRDAVELWWQFWLRDTWLARTRLAEGDAGVQPFFAEHIVFLSTFGDPQFRTHLADELVRLAGPR